MKVYRFYNTRKEEYGRPFALCPAHRLSYNPNLPDFIILEEVQDAGKGWRCDTCRGDWHRTCPEGRPEFLTPGKAQSHRREQDEGIIG